MQTKYTVNSLSLQANVASAVLTQVKLECTCSVPKVYVQCRLNVGYVEPKKQRYSVKIKKAVPSTLA